MSSAITTPPPFRPPHPGETMKVHLELPSGSTRTFDFLPNEPISSIVGGLSMELPPSELKTDPNRSGHPEHYELRYNGKAIGAFPHDDMTLKECGVIEGSKLMMVNLDAPQPKSSSVKTLNVLLELPNGSTRPFDFHPNEPLSSIIARLWSALPASELGAEPGRRGDPVYELRFNGEAIGKFPYDDMTLTECGVVEGSKLTFGAPLRSTPDEPTNSSYPSSEPQLTTASITIRTLTGSAFAFVVDLSSKLWDFREAVSASTGIPWGGQRLVFGGRELRVWTEDDQNTLRELGLSSGLTILMILSIRKEKQQDEMSEQ